MVKLYLSSNIPKLKFDFLNHNVISIRNVQKQILESIFVITQNPTLFAHCNKTLCKISHLRTLCSLLASKYSHKK